MRSKVFRFLSSDRGAAFLFFIASAAYGILAQGYASTMSDDVFGPSLFPTSVAVLGMVAAVSLFVSARPREVEQDETRSSGFAVAPFVPIVALLAYTFALQLLGFLVATMVFMVFSIRFLGCSSLAKSVVVAAVTTFGVYFLFRDALGAYLPSGVLLTYFGIV